MVLVYTYWEKNIQDKYFCIRLNILCMFSEILMLCLVKADRCRTVIKCSTRTGQLKDAKICIKTSIISFFFLSNFLLVKSNA